MKLITFLAQLMFLTLFFTCKVDSQIVQEKEVETISEKEYLRHVGDINHDPSMDDDNFKVCNGDDNVLQYFNLGHGPVYVGEKSTILNKFRAEYKPVLGKQQNGLIRIRFIVNCEGNAGRFRVIQADSNLNAINFEEQIVSQLLEITKSIDKWVILYNDDKKAIDYYNYLIFKLIDGRITEILP